ncbi:hypothetical protein G7B40_029625 [Aetokthonos hydrillicola Thurmond2011]|jgi:hypothetical protein|uniref:Uncharacterized protein n=1 Tax=Aetokthonos hydrillicola Thurmond2011 TaxID=2712845 RepID=A0AAP5M809_9CYAN|nr:hypothetical protein [Aetokthonos hydrillicola]MBO3463941.1 hypothetical protein [Aetokthonos hydrillicola CCALA 1050]MBW4589128.1 hypothetical protein [Aetokthonos hydrillicola CCALA 1050]MDR9898686.1 hypothetical protein [Aetokthonos hydrillicola Thurmond2011]
MKKSLLSRLLIISVFLNGCLQFGENYSDTDGKPAPIAVIEKWIGAPLPSNYSDLKYKIINDTPDKHVEIALKVQEIYYKHVIKNLVRDEHFLKDKILYLNNENSPNAFMKPPSADTPVWTSKEGFYHKYIWYQNSTLYVSYVEG